MTQVSRLALTVFAASAVMNTAAIGQTTQPAEHPVKHGEGRVPAAEKAVPATSQPAEAPAFFRLDYSGDFLTSPAMTGDWGGARTKLAEEGISFNVETLNYFQGNAHGGKSTNDAFRYGGSTDYFLQLDTGRMGLWPGGYFKVRGETRWGHGVDDFAGSVAPPDFDSLLPTPEPDGVTTLTEYYMMQFLCKEFGIIAGMVDLTRLPGGNEFMSDPYTQFMNTALWYNPVAFSTVPYAAMTVGAIYAPTDWLSGATLVVDSNGWPTYSGFETGFHSPQGATVIQAITATIKPFGQVGHQRFNFSISTRERYQLDDLNRLALSGLASPNFSRLDLKGPSRSRGSILGSARSGLRRHLFSRVIEPDKSSEDWAFWYNFDQYLYTDPKDPNQGFGLFGGFGWAPENFNPATTSYMLGVGGKGLVPTRAHDRYGVGYYYLDFSSDLPSIMNANAEQGVEIFYNIEVTPWLHISPDLQVIIDPGGNTGHGQREPALVYGMRAQVSL